MSTFVQCALVLAFAGPPARADILLTLHNRSEAALVIVRAGPPPFPDPNFPDPGPRLGRRGFPVLVDAGRSHAIRIPDREADLDAEVTVRSLPGAEGFVIGEVAVMPLPPPDDPGPEPEARGAGPWDGGLDQASEGGSCLP